MAQNPNIDDDTRARAMRFVANKTIPVKQRIVSKKELEDSGLNLRDFLNKERGLTRRNNFDPTAGEAKDKAAQEAADAIDPAFMASQAAGAKRSGLDVDTYVRSGKQTIDQQDGTFGKKSGGKINLKDCKTNTCEKNPKCKSF